jgi:hypothetical protein
MNDEQKIALMDRIIAIVRDSQTSEDMPVLVGTLVIKTGLKGFKPAEIGHPVFEYKGQYIIYLESNDGKTAVKVPYHKETLADYITPTG